ncbi:MAG: hypothetical protein ACJATA_001386 [Sphingobacteriales bacterium]|jgi:uncharacterized protein (TIGR00255 family)
MVLSMTGYGNQKTEWNSWVISVEVKTLNSKFLDLTLKFPKLLNEKELPIRNTISKALTRGKVFCGISVTKSGEVKGDATINTGVVKGYIKSLRALSEEMKVDESAILQVAMGLPDAISNSEQELDPELWKIIEETINNCLAKANAFRTDEGKSLATDLNQGITAINGTLDKIIAMDPQRMEHQRQRLNNAMEQISDRDRVDQNRFEQELIYYIEKLDINEEKVRLTNHLNYFTETINTSGAQGKKLGFISQEIGREVNTIGSKANHAEVQQLVVQMKDELEKIKEQLLNVV